MWPMKNAIMRMGKGRDKNIITPGTIIWECALACVHLFLTVWPLALWANSVFWSLLLKALLLSARLTQARDSQSESNYKHNYNCDLVRPGFVFKHTHLPWALELHLLRSEYEPGVCQTVSGCYSTDVCLHPGTYSQSEHAYLSAERITAFLFHQVILTDLFKLNHKISIRAGW